jgi:hypothetical protein
MARISSPMIDRAPCARALEGVSTVSTGTKLHKKLDDVLPDVGAFVYLFCNRTNLFILMMSEESMLSGLAWHLSGEPDAGRPRKRSSRSAQLAAWRENDQDPHSHTGLSFVRQGNSGRSCLNFTISMPHKNIPSPRRTYPSFAGGYVC